MEIPIIIITTAIATTRNDVGKQEARKRPAPNEIKTIPKPQFLRLLITTPH